MGIQKLIHTHFNPHTEPKQFPEDSQANYLCLGSGGGLFATAAIGFLFFKMRPSTASMCASAGAGFIASGLTEKDGYAWLVGIVASAGLIAATVDAIQSGRLLVSIKFDIADIIRAIKNQKKNH